MLRRCTDEISIIDHRRCAEPQAFCQVRVAVYQRPKIFPCFPLGQPLPTGSFCVASSTSPCSIRSLLSAFANLNQAPTNGVCHRELVDLLLQARDPYPVEVIEDERLREIDFGILDGLTKHGIAHFHTEEKERKLKLGNTITVRQRARRLGDEPLTIRSNSAQIYARNSECGPREVVQNTVERIDQTLRLGARHGRDTERFLTLFKHIFVLRVADGQRSFSARAHHKLESHRSGHRSDE